MTKILGTPEIPAEEVKQTVAPTDSPEIKAISSPVTALAAIALRDAPTENQTSIPEKVSGLEILAAAGLPTPNHRLYLDKKYFEGGDHHHELKGKVDTFIAGIPKNGAVTIMVRSAHPREQEFRGGAFESQETTLVRDNSAFTKISRTRQKIIEVSSPQHAPAVRRDILLHDISEFDVNDMGIYLNEKVSSLRQITAVPLDDGKISLRYFNNGTPRTDIVDPAVNPRDILQFLVLLGGPTRLTPIMIDLQALVCDIVKAQACFDTPQEFEIHIEIEDLENGIGKWVFVQTKSVEPESTLNDEIPGEMFERGVKIYHPNHSSSHPYEIIRANKRDILRQTQAIVINEEQWLAEWIRENMPELTRYDGQYIFDHVGENRLHRYFQAQKFILENPAAYESIMAKYRALIDMTTQMPLMTLVEKKTIFAVETHRLEDWKKDPAIGKITEMRDMLASLSSVYFHGKTAGDNNIHQDTHTILGTNKLAQIHLLYQLDQQGDNRNYDDWEILERMKQLQDGDPLTVMIRGGKASLYVPEQE